MPKKAPRFAMALKSTSAEDTATTAQSMVARSFTKFKVSGLIPSLFIVLSWMSFCSHEDYNIVSELMKGALTFP